MVMALPIFFLGFEILCFFWGIGKTTTNADDNVLSFLILRCADRTTRHVDVSPVRSSVVEY